MMNFLVTGANGQLGRAFQKVLPKKDSFFAGRETFDITDRGQTVSQIVELRPEIVIHAAAYTDVDSCEKNRDLAWTVNVWGTENVAMGCQKVGATMVYISTDYVFDGKKKSPYREKDRPNPLLVYGQSKLAGEELVLKLPRHLVVRTAWLYGEGKNFVKTILNLASKGDSIQVVNDQRGSPTYAVDLARGIKKLLEVNPAFGIYHLANQGDCSWYEFAKEILKVKGRTKKVKVVPITTAQWRKIRPESAKRPVYSVLSTDKAKKIGLVLRPWQAALKDYLKTL